VALEKRIAPNVNIFISDTEIIRMSSVPSITKTLLALADFDLLTQLPAIRERKDRVLLRWVDDADDTPILTPIFSSWLTLCDRIGLLFGSRELFLGKTCEIAQQSLSSAHDISFSPSCVASIRRTVVYLNEKIHSYNQAHRETELTATALPLLTIPEHAFCVDEQGLRVSLPVCGIANTGNKCYLISTLVTLCGSEQLKRTLALANHPSEANVLLRLAFRQLEITTASWLSMCQEPFSGLINVLGMVFEPLRGGAAVSPFAVQQDAHEVMLHLLELVLGTTGLIHFREIVTRSSSTKKREGDNPLLDNVFIPSVDSKSLTRQNAIISTDNILQVSIPNLTTYTFPLKMAFSGIPGRENVEVNAILNHEENNGKIPPELRLKLLQEGEKRGGTLDALPVIRRLILCGEPPAVLPLQLVRFRTRPVVNRSGAVVGFRREKIKTCVDVAFDLSVPVIGRDNQQYVLRGVVVHLGETLESGHYVSCLPDLLSLRDSNGMPTVWHYYDDGKPVQKRSWKSLSEIVGRGGYLFIYDKV
jgi:ubiquitin C-terminal hydrolase